MSAIEAMRFALARWDGAGLARAARLAEGARGELETRLATLWLAWLRGTPWREEDAASIESDAGKLRAADLVIDGASTRAIALLHQDRIEEAIGVARRAARMASTEGLRGPHALAAVTLARVRAAAGQPVHATRILESLGGWVSPAWSGWLACERLLVSGAIGTGTEADDACPAARAASALAAVLEAAMRGDRRAFDTSAASLRVTTAALGPISRRAHAMTGLLDPHLDPDTLDEDVAEFVRGEGASLPLGLGGLGVSGAHDDATAWILRTPRGAGRRVARAGLALAGASPIVATQRRTGREDVALAMLALAGDEGVEYAQLHRRVYRTPYESGIHDATLRVLAHRIGARLGSAGRVQARAGRVALMVSEAVVVPDPRCALSMEDRVLNVLARHGRSTAREVAAELDAPLRTVQQALRELVEDGACREEPQGRKLEYVVEDTAYSEPTGV
ncbi:MULTISPECIES: helix-turn-helix transcriptional regulator [Sandaracinus]|uniref:helix-turn-helix transcriptional regulator n=1 Tax=Sandaracinus TaxID=1055688 RepID=UPI0019D470AA|nr:MULTISPECIES: winged helix-turn-helix domain-containing protein [Sandaracinus]QRN75815.1 Hypothetical protein MSR10575_89020 [Sandaracinus sp.]UJR87341.1 TrmB domain-containing protein [Sandaracinus amylolyticus]